MKLKTTKREIDAFFFPVESETRVESPMENVLVFYIDVRKVIRQSGEQYIGQYMNAIIKELDDSE